MLPVDPQRSRVTQSFAARGRYASHADAHGPAGHHTGIDYGDDESGAQIDGQQVRTIVPGEVVISGHNSTMGDWVGVWDSRTDLLVTYWHLRDRAVSLGQHVALGTVVGHVGSTGNSTAAHLHLQCNRGRTFSYHGHIDPAVAINAYQEVTPMRIDGVDISHHQSGPIDWAAAKRAGVKFAYHKAAEGATYRDPMYAKRRAECKAAGIPFGAYHFSRPDADGRDAVTEARFFWAYAKPVAGDCFPVLDHEAERRPEGWAKEFMAEILRLATADGLEPEAMHYGPDDFGSDYPFLRWVPRYNNDNRPPKVRWDIWQFSNGVYGRPNSVPGLGHVDLNTMRDGLKVEDFTLRAKPKPPQPAPGPKPAHVLLANVGITTKAWKVFAAVIWWMTRYDSDILFLVETSERQRNMLKRLGRAAVIEFEVAESWPGKNECSIVVRKRMGDRFRAWSIRCSKTWWGHKARRTHDPRTSVAMLLSGEGYGVGHRPPGVDYDGDDTPKGKADRVAADIEWAQVHTKALKGWNDAGRPWLFAADWNEQADRDGMYSPKWMAEQLGATIASAGGIDYFMTRGLRVVNVRQHWNRLAADHKVVTAEIKR